MHFLLENMQELLAGDTEEKAETLAKIPCQT
jgi:hypothetical protein